MRAKASSAGERRARRRRDTESELLDVALAVMAEHGVAGMSLGEVARRMGMRTPSLYEYVASKSALYDALFERGARDVLAAMQQVADQTDTGLGLVENLARAGDAFVSWCTTNPMYAQLLYWRPVPGFQPSPTAFAPALELVSSIRSWLERLRGAGLVRADSDLDAAVRDWMVMVAGVVSQQMSNEPAATPGTGRFVAALPGLARMFAAEYGAPAPTTTKASR